jgi:hypothetical protein
MLVSGHTISVWVDWDDVPKHLHSLVKDKSDNDIIIHCPITMKEDESLLAFIRSIKPIFYFQLDDGGIMFYKKGIDLCIPVAQ